MEDICRKCGGLLFEAKTCDCDCSIEKKVPDNYLRKTLRNITNIINSFFKKPFKTTIYAIQESLTVCMSIVCIHAIAGGVFFSVLIPWLVGQTSSWLPYIDRSLGLGGWFRYWGSTIGIPYFEIFIKVFILFILQFFTLASLFYIGGKLFGKKEGSFKSVLSVMGVVSLIPSLALLISSLFIPILPSAAAYLFLFGFACTLLLNHSGIREIFGIEENKGVLITPLVYMLYFFVLSALLLESLKAVGY